ncbi:MAG: polysaccharide deacetylase family protein [Chloroflexi bacterium]|nr:MAG: polysaccharide deacetylase family protein [Chloroflexota bacterium]
MTDRRGRRSRSQPTWRRVSGLVALLILTALGVGAVVAFPALTRRTATVPVVAGRVTLRAPATLAPADVLNEVDGAAGQLLPTPAPGPTLNIGPLRGHPVTVPVLLYHYVRVNPHTGDRLGYLLSVTPRAFAAQMTLLRQSDVHPVSLGDVVGAMQGAPPLPPHPVVITFDDGYEDFFTEALPVLRENGFPATLFVVPAFLERDGYMTTRQVQQTARMGITIGAHTVDHLDLTKLPLSAARTEIEASRVELRDLTGQPVDDFAYPYGRFNSPIEALVQAAGFRDAVTTHDGRTQTPQLRYAMFRYGVTGRDTLLTFAAQVGAKLSLASSLQGSAGPSSSERMTGSRVQ